MKFLTLSLQAFMLVAFMVALGCNRTPKSAGPVTSGDTVRAPVSPFDNLDAANIPAERRLPGQPAELLAVLNSPAQKGYFWTEVALSPDGRWLASANAAGVLSVWNTGTFKEAARAKGNCPVFAGDSKSLAFVAGQYTHVWDVTGAQPKERLSFESHTKPLDSVAFSPDGKTLATGSQDSTILLWDVSGEKQRELDILKGHTKAIQYLSFSHDGKMLASCSSDFTARVYDIEAGKAKFRAAMEHKNNGGSVRFSHDGKFLAATTPDEKGTLWDLTPKEPKVHARLLGHDKRVTSVSFSNDGKTVVSTSADGRVIFWDKSGKKLHEWTMPHPVSDALFSSNGNHLIVANGNGTVYVLQRPKY